ncbi:hypothetical protein Tsubulata_026893 [Turnera subulata]|uniref:Uncharacterized protein n=1 Tax=Turnera subulata TaxID=218843 RepID=A0A9Q0FL89_9ROSI|nr:hypothetical protein Tsubulata_026893 [Turnera subulata]
MAPRKRKAEGEGEGGAEKSEPKVAVTTTTRVTRSSTRRANSGEPPAELPVKKTNNNNKKKKKAEAKEETLAEVKPDMVTDTKAEPEVESEPEPEAELDSEKTGTVKEVQMTRTVVVEFWFRSLHWNDRTTLGPWIPGFCCLMTIAQQIRAINIIYNPINSSLVCSKQCQQFKKRATMVKDGLEKAVPGINVLLNPDKPRRGCLEIREEGGEKFISLLDMKRPFQPMKDLDMDQIISDIIDKLK